MGFRGWGREEAGAGLSVGGGRWRGCEAAAGLGRGAGLRVLPPAPARTPPCRPARRGAVLPQTRGCWALPAPPNPPAPA